VGIFSRIKARLAEFSSEHHRSSRGIFAADEFSDRALARGVLATGLGALVADPNLPIVARGHIGEGRVKITHFAHAKAQNNPLGAALDFRFGQLDDPLALAAIYGIVGALDETLR
jgi:hypothetical protein